MEAEEGGGVCVSVTYLHLAQRVEELIVAVGEHVQLVASIALRLLLGLGQAGLVPWRQLDVDLHVLQNAHTKSNQNPTPEDIKRSCIEQS